MTPQAVDDETIEQTSIPNDPIGDSGVMEDAHALWNELCTLIYDRFRLAALEAQRAGQSLVTMIVLGMMVAVLLIAAWLGLMAAMVMKLVENGLIASSAVLLAVAVNLLCTLILYGVIRRKSRYLRFPATLRGLKPNPVHRHVVKSNGSQPSKPH